MKDLTLRIRQARRKATLSQLGLANKVGVNRSAVAQWERPGGCRPTTENLSKIALATSIQFEWLATGRGRMHTPDGGNDEGDQTPALLLQFYAHDEVEERILIALRRLDYWQSVSIAELVESLARGKLSLMPATSGDR